MISFEAVDATIAAWISGVWDESRYGPIAHENVVEDPRHAFSFLRLYVRKSQRPIGGRSPGAREGRIRGQIVLVGYGPLGQGKSVPSQVIDAARAILEEQSHTSDGIAVRVELATDETSAPDKPWHKVMVSLPFWAEAV